MWSARVVARSIAKMRLQGGRVRRHPRLRELVALAVLAAFGCGLALSQGDLLFVAIFGAACAMTIIETIRRFP